MSEVKKTVSIAGRSYPLNVEGEDLRNIEKASALINDVIKVYEESYAVRDKQDLLAMCLIHFANQLVKATTEQTPAPPIDGQLAQLENFLNDYLENEISKKVTVV